MTDWIMNISPMLFTRIKSEFSEKIKTKYNMKDTNFSTTDFKNKTPVFPFVFIKQMPAQITSTDLERNSISGMDFYFQVDVFDNKSQARANEVMREILRIMVSKMRFQPKPAPSFDSVDDVYRMTVRFERKIDYNDIL